MFPFVMRRATFGVTTIAALVCAAGPVSAQTSTQTANPVQKAGNLAVELRLPAEGIFAGEETDLEFRVTDTGRTDPVQGAPGVIRANISGAVTMPTMASMPAAHPQIHAEGVPGDYGLVTTFPHGGDYEIALTIAPPGDNGPEKVTVKFLVSVKDAGSGKRKPAPSPYTLAIRSAPYRPSAGQMASISLTIKNRATDKPVAEWDEVHTQPVHVIIVSDDLSTFFHEHPKLNADGTFTEDFTFPTGGEWRIFADCAPKGAGSQVVMDKITVDGVRPLRTNIFPKNPPFSVREGSYTLQLKTASLPARQTLPVTFTLTDSQGNSVTDLELWLGSLAHLILIEKDGQTFVHCHPDESDPRNGRTGTLTFLARFPKPGTYKGWLQFQRAGIVNTIPFVVRASDNK